MGRLVAAMGLVALVCVEMVCGRAMAADAQLRIVITNAAVDVEGKGQFHVHPAGQHDGSEITWSGSGGTVNVPAGSYDVAVIFDDGAAHKELWLDNLRLAGKVSKSVEMNLPVAEAAYLITNGGIDTEGNGQFHLHPAGRHEGPEITWAGSGGTVRVPAASYDVFIVFNDGAAHKEFWLDNQKITGAVKGAAEIGLPIAEVAYLITNGGVDAQGTGQVHLFDAGNHEGSEITWAGSGGSMRVPAGAYDVHVVFDDGAAHKDFWIDNQTFAGKVEKSAEVDMPLAEVSYIVANGGVDVEGKGQFHIFAAGHPDAEVGWAGSGGSVRLAAGVYDVHVLFEDGPLHKDKWLRRQKLAGAVHQTVEIGAKQAIATVRYIITNGGIDVRSEGQFHIFPAGQHEGEEAGWAGSGDPVRVLENAYDVHILFSDGAAHKELWLDNQALKGKFEKTVEINLLVAEVKYSITNGGVDTQSNGQFHLHPAGQHDGAEIAWAGSGGSVRIPAGAYDVAILFDDGAARKEVWIDNQAFKGKVAKSVEINLPVAEARYVVANGGVDVADKGQFHIYPAGRHDALEVAWSGSGGAVRLPAGAYDVAITYIDRLIHKTKWLDGEALSGKVDKTVELGLRFAEPTVTVTRNGKDVGDAANVGFIDPSTHDEIGSVKSGEAAQLEAGVYDIRADLFGAEGFLRGLRLEGAQALTIELEPLKVEQLKVGGPPPKACAIEVYGVNFDFDKSVLRPESEPILKQVLSLFTGAPDFQAEVGGHTDNFGKPDYNVKLSDARAAAVKLWLIAHGVTSERVSSHGYGDTRPLVPNTTDENRFKNRRVELRTAKCR